DDGNIFRRAGPDHRGGIDTVLRETGPAMGSERVEAVSGRDRRTRGDLVCAETLRELRESRAHADGNAEALFNRADVTSRRGLRTRTHRGSSARPHPGANTVWLASLLRN